MATTSARADRVYHQDYIARIRYSNTLPPPPNPPKLLNIPGTGLESGHYVSAAYTSRMAREQPQNIEADAELGMPIDLVGLPGVFDGDESCIQSLDNPPPPHPHDRPLLKPLSSLGKTATTAAGVTFLRRTEYISSDQGRSRLDTTNSRDTPRSRSEPKKRKRYENENEDDPAYVLGGVVRSFAIANPGEITYTDASFPKIKVDAADIAAWTEPTHPTQPTLKLLDSYPILPDLEANPETGSYIVTKFVNNPVNTTDQYDTRLNVAILRPLPLSEREESQRNADLAAQEADPSMPILQTWFNYEYYLPSDSKIAESVKRKLDVNNEGNEDPALYENELKEGEDHFNFHRIRAYETYQQSGSGEEPYGEFVALALHDLPEDTGESRLQKAAYVYPISQRTFLRPRRIATTINAGMPIPTEEDDSRVDLLELSIRKPDTNGNDELADTSEADAAHFVE